MSYGPSSRHRFSWKKRRKVGSVGTGVLAALSSLPEGASARIAAGPMRTRTYFSIGDILLPICKPRSSADVQTYPLRRTCIYIPQAQVVHGTGGRNVIQHAASHHGHSGLSSARTTYFWRYLDLEGRYEVIILPLESSISRPLIVYRSLRVADDIETRDNLKTFRAEFKGDLITPDDEGYDVSIHRWAHNAIKRAGIVAYVKDPEDVARAIKYAVAAKLDIAIHSGGHSPAGNSSTKGGLVIDLSRFINHVNVDTEKKLAYVGGGANWGMFDAATIKHGLAGVAGTVHHTGVGGLATGGGYGWLSARHGLTIDNVATVVTADGSILKANDKENPDLFWGIRGGGCNFGVVTEFVMKVYPQRTTVFCGIVVFHPEKLDKIAAYLDDWWPRATENEGIVVILTRGPDGSPNVVCFVNYNGTEAEGRAAYKPLFDIGPLVDTAKDMDYLQLNVITNSLAEPGLNYYFKGALLSRDKPSADLNQEKFAKIMDLTKDRAHTTACVLEYIPHTKINSVPEGVTPFRRDLPGNILINSQWKGDEPEKLASARELTHGIAELFINEVGYGNYGTDQDAMLTRPGQTSPDKVKALFRENYPRLQTIKKKYDPNMIFNKWYNITPA
ncbi:hypothetical protein EIP91_001070 [Steccherinum ochraceum]|uniref:FAD-binding PCMH-type domain-containing protein n=1 Tax=Steccherinum ochraceum TaxID=92696 RepID=A0A4R0RHP9_9APHY|nr:hypothetical protein EIP91_001070 [Steccherinum ochraceum]